jgi:DNA-binding SARP family transcriptional activator
MLIGRAENGLSFKLFGGANIQLNGNPLTGFNSGKSQGLLCYLAMNRRKHPRSSLANLLWGDLPDEKAHTNLRQTLANLRQLLGDRLEIDRSSVGLNPNFPATLDVEEFHSGLTQFSRLQLPERHNLREVVTLYEGDFMEGFDAANSLRFEDWVLSERAKWKSLALHAMHKLTDIDMEEGNHTAGIQLALRQLEIEPSLEEAHRQLMLLLIKEGQRSAALLQFKACVEILRESLDVEPSLETKHIYQLIVDGSSELEILEKRLISPADKQARLPSQNEPLLDGLIKG